jgi:hypothetical protein
MTTDRKTIMKLAAESELDPRTVRRALEHGVDSLRAETDRNRFREAAKKLGVKTR